MSQEASLRCERGRQICDLGNQVRRLDENTYAVKSQSGHGEYEVRATEAGWLCSCPDSSLRGEKCKHTFAVEFSKRIRTEVELGVLASFNTTDSCIYCGSKHIVKDGQRHNKSGSIQKFNCLDCRHKFTEKALLKGSRYTPEMVSLTLDLYFSGTSLRKTARILNSHFGLHLVNSTVHKWIQKLVPRISEYARTLTPELSADWHADELFVKMKGGINYKAHYGGEAKNIAFLWNVMDRKTRFLLASKLSRWRDVAGADRAYREALSNAGQRPETIYTDALKSYQTLMASLPEPERPRHIANAGVSKRHATNNRIERLNGTLRERVKVQRGWKNPASKIAEGQRIHYNFVKPHESLEGQTPAERAGIGVQGENKWLELLKASLTQQVEESN